VNYLAARERGAEFRAQWTAMTAEAALMRRGGGGAIVDTSGIGSRRANPPCPPTAP
jgi:hypothetical protein